MNTRRKMECAKRPKEWKMYVRIKVEREKGEKLRKRRNFQPFYRSHLTETLPLDPWQSLLGHHLSFQLSLVSLPSRIFNILSTNQSPILDTFTILYCTLNNRSPVEAKHGSLQSLLEQVHSSPENKCVLPYNISLPFALSLLLLLSLAFFPCAISSTYWIPKTLISFSIQH